MEIVLQTFDKTQIIYDEFHYKILNIQDQKSDYQKNNHQHLFLANHKKPSFIQIYSRFI